jgi:hypothetical protein
MEVRWYHIYGRYPQFRFLKWPSMEVKDPQIMPRMPSKVKSEKQLCPYLNWSYLWIISHWIVPQLHQHLSPDLVRPFPVTFLEDPFLPWPKKTPSLIPSHGPQVIPTGQRQPAWHEAKPIGPEPRRRCPELSGTWNSHWIHGMCPTKNVKNWW